jgi:hypothetical protein
LWLLVAAVVVPEVLQEMLVALAEVLVVLELVLGYR